jgi:hypothetical protein
MKTSRAQSKTDNLVSLEPSSAPSSKTADQIATAAYLRAEMRGFEPGHELEDWLAAEAEEQ